MGGRSSAVSNQHSGAVLCPISIREESLGLAQRITWHVLQKQDDSEEGDSFVLSVP